MTTFPTFKAEGNRLLLALVAGAIFPLGLAPLNYWWLIPFSLLALYGLIRKQPAKIAAKRAFAYGFGFNGVGVSWVYVSIHYYGGTPIWLSALGTALFAAFLSVVFCALPFWGYRRLNLDRHYLLTFPALWVLIEWSKSWFLSGFPWLWAGYGFIDTPLASFAPIVGTLGISALAAIMAMLLYILWRGTTQHRFFAALGITAPWLIGWALMPLQWTQLDSSKPLTVAIVQGNIPQQQKWDPSFRKPIIDTFVSMTDSQWDKDLILWPEAAYPVFYHQALNTIARLDIDAAQSDTALISGVARWDQDQQGNNLYYNSVFVIGAGQGMYDKQKLVPFGEYVPLQSLIRGLIPFFNLPMSSFSEGDADQLPLMAKHHPFSVFICYEIVYPELVRKQSIGRDFLVTISNDAWFGHSWGPLQHFEMARMRALEVGRYLLRGTNTGITAIIDHKGKVINQLEQFTQGTLEGELLNASGSTPFQRFGQYPILAAAFLAILITLGLRAKHRPE